MATFLGRVREFLGGALRELPAETVVVLAAAVSIILAIQDIDGIPAVWLARVICTAPVVVALAFSLSLFARAGRIPRRLQVALAAVAGVAVLAAVRIGLATTRSDGEGFMWRYGASLVAALMTPFATVAIAAPREDRFEAFVRFVRRFLDETTVFGLLGGTALAALAVTFAAVAELFDLRVEKLGFQIAAVVVAGITLAWLYRLLSDEGSGQVPDLWRRLVTAVGAPFVAVMLVILTLYEVWAVARHELPRNVLSPLVIVAGAVGFVCTLVIVAILRQPVGTGSLTPAEPHRWARARSVQIARAFPLPLLALLPMAFFALAIRLEEHGVTPARAARLYALVLLGILALGGSLRYLRRRPPLAWEVPTMVAGLALVAAFGPFSIVSLSTRSQLHRLDAMLAAAGVEDRSVGAVHAKTTIAADQFDDIAERLSLIERLAGAGQLRQVLSGEVERCADGRMCLELLGVVRGEEAGQDEVLVTVPSETVFEVGASELQRIHIDADHPHRRGDEVLSLLGSVVEARLGDRLIGRASLEGVLPDDGTAFLAARSAPFEGEAASRLGHLVVLSIVGEREQGTLHVRSLEAIWLRPAPPALP